MNLSKLMEKAAEKNSVIVVGIDPVISRFPGYILKNNTGVYAQLMAFGKEVIDGVYKNVPAIKFQSAYFESYGIEGMKALRDLIEYGRGKDLYIIADVKRGDIGSTAEAYARAYFEKGSDFEVDCITVNPYLGDDSNEAFYKYADKYDKGVFVLVKTSNSTSDQIQDLIIEDEEIFIRVARGMKDNKFYQSDDKFSRIGAVVGATYPKQLAEVRKILPGSVLLIPGYGAQGGKGEDLRNAFDEEGLSAIVNSSRGIIYAYEKRGMAIKESAREAVDEMNKDLNKWRFK
ncbi:MAG: orotidine-5'-phosphate decarboxylase [Clostridiales bacterium]|nr:orotidine-5'-phosphate decarboxylase [Clostridiales bacterium]